MYVDEFKKYVCLLRILHNYFLHLIRNIVYSLHSKRIHLSRFLTKVHLILHFFNERRFFNAFDIFQTQWNILPRFHGVILLLKLLKYMTTLYCCRAGIVIMRRSLHRFFTRTTITKPLKVSEPCFFVIIRSNFYYISPHCYDFQGGTIFLYVL